MTWLPFLLQNQLGICPFFKLLLFTSNWFGFQALWTWEVQYYWQSFIQTTGSMSTLPAIHSQPAWRFKGTITKHLNLQSSSAFLQLFVAVLQDHSNKRHPLWPNPWLQPFQVHCNPAFLTEAKHVQHPSIRHQYIYKLFQNEIWGLNF